MMTKSIHYHTCDNLSYGQEKLNERPEHTKTYVRTANEVLTNPELEEARVCIKDLLPHNPPMILLDRVVAFRDDFIHAAVTIQEGSAFFVDGEVPSYVALEYMAQAIGVWRGILALHKNQSPQIGFLLGTRSLKLEVPAFQEGAELDVYGQSKYTDGEVAAFDCWVEIQGTRVVHASLNVYQPENLDQFLNERNQ